MECLPNDAKNILHTAGLTLCSCYYLAIITTTSTMITTVIFSILHPTAHTTTTAITSAIITVKYSRSTITVSPHSTASATSVLV